LHWILSAIALLIVSHFVPGFIVRGLIPALIAAVVIGLLNATVGLLLKIITFPSAIVPGFHVTGLGPAFWGALILALLGMLIRAIVKDV
jgi:putative membrane protein